MTKSTEVGLRGELQKSQKLVQNCHPLIPEAKAKAAAEAEAEAEAKAEAVAKTKAEAEAKATSFAQISYQQGGYTPSELCVDKSQTAAEGPSISGMLSLDIGVTCCYDEDSLDPTNAHRPGCASAKTYDEAVAQCAANSNSVLCTNEQLTKSMARYQKGHIGLGCGFDGYYNWVRDPCPKAAAEAMP